MSKLVSQLRIIAQLSNWSNAVVCNQAADEIERLTHLVNTPMFQPFDRAVKLEAAHQVSTVGVPSMTGRRSRRSGSGWSATSRGRPSAPTCLATG